MSENTEALISDRMIEPEVVAPWGRIAFWPVVPRIANPAHRSGPLSVAYLALSVPPLGRRLIAEPLRLKHVGPPPYARAAHLRNLALDLPRTIAFAPAFLSRSAAEPIASSVRQRSQTQIGSGVPQ